MCITEWESVEKHGRETLSSVIGCCRVIIGTSSLSYVLTSRPEVLVSRRESFTDIYFLFGFAVNFLDMIAVNSVAILMLYDNSVYLFGFFFQMEMLEVGDLKFKFVLFLVVLFGLLFT